MIVVRNTKVHFKKIKDKIVILEENRQYLQKLNSVASFIWENLEVAKTDQQIVDLVCQEFEVTPQIAQTDVQIFLSDFLKSGLIISTTLPT